MILGGAICDGALLAGGGSTTRASAVPILDVPCASAPILAGRWGIDLEADLSDSVTATDMRALGPEVALSDALAASDAASRSSEVSLADSTAPSDAVALTTDKVLADSAQAIEQSEPRDYLQFNGTTHFAHAEGAFGSIAGTYTVAVKVARAMIGGGSGGGGGTYFATGGPGPNVNTESGYDLHLRLGASGTTSYLFAQRPDTGANLYSFSTGHSVGAGRKVLAVKRTSGGTAKNRVISPTGVDYSDDRAAVLAGIPSRLVIGARITNALALYTQPGPVSWVAAIVVDGEVSDADLQAWCADSVETPFIPGVHLSNVVGYWVAADVSGGVVPGRIGGDMTLSGVSASDLVGVRVNPTFGVEVVKADSLAPTDAAALAADKALSDSSAASDSRVLAPEVTLSDSATGADAQSLAPELAVADSASPTDATSREAGLGLSDAAASSDALARSADVALADSASGTDGVTLAPELALEDEVGATEAITQAVGLGLADSPSVTDGLSRDVELALVDLANLVDVLGRGAELVVDDDVATDDQTSLGPELALDDEAGATDEPDVVLSRQGAGIRIPARSPLAVLAVRSPAAHITARSPGVTLRARR